MSRRTRTGARSERRLWRCAHCGGQFSVLVGTILQGTRLSLWTWIGVLRDWTAEGTLPRVTQLQERYGLSAEAARRLLARLEFAARYEPLRGVLAEAVRTAG